MVFLMDEIAHDVSDNTLDVLYFEFSFVVVCLEQKNNLLKSPERRVRDPIMVKLRFILPWRVTACS